MILGLILILLGALTVIAAVGTADGSAELLGIDINALTMFLIGVAAGAAILWGFALAKWGTKRNLRQRRETKRLNELSEKLDRHEAERRHDSDDDRGDRSY